MKRLIIPFLLIYAFTGCKKETNSSSENADPNLYGYWQVDSITNIEGGNTRTASMDAIYGQKVNPETQIVMFIAEGGAATSTGYHYTIEGNWKMDYQTNLTFTLKEAVDYAGRLNTDWQPLVIKAFNDTKTYKIEGSGARNSQLFLYYANSSQVVRCTKR